EYVHNSGIPQPRHRHEAHEGIDRRRARGRLRPRPASRLSEGGAGLSAAWIRARQRGNAVGFVIRKYPRCRGSPASRPHHHCAKPFISSCPLGLTPTPTSSDTDVLSSVPSQYAVTLNTPSDFTRSTVQVFAPLANVIIP